MADPIELPAELQSVLYPALSCVRASMKIRDALCGIGLLDYYDVKDIIEESKLDETET